MSILNSILYNPKLVTLGFDLGKFFENLTTKAKEWGGYFIMFLGAILIIWGVVNIVKAFVSNGRGQTNWLMTAAMILVGGLFLAGGFTAMQNFATMGKDTLEQLGHT